MSRIFPSVIVMRMAIGIITNTVGVAGIGDTIMVTIMTTVTGSLAGAIGMKIANSKTGSIVCVSIWISTATVM